MVARRRRRSSRNPTTIPAGRPRWTAYYDIDPSDPPTIAQVAEAWTRDVKARESTSAMAWYSLAEILRGADPGNYLREMPGTAKARAFKASVKRRGITEPVMLEIDRDGVRHWTTLAADIDRAGTPHPVPGLATPCGSRGDPEIGQCLNP